VKGGFGSASAVLASGVTVGAAVVVNSLGRAWKPKTCEPNVDYLFTGGFGSLATPSAAACAAAGIGTPQIVGNVVGVVATNFALDKAETQKMAGIAQDGMARAVTPSHTLYDGDVAFGMATGTIQSVGQCLANTPGLVPTVCALVLNDIYAAAADIISIAAMRALLNASSVAGIRSFCDTFSACGSTGSLGGASSGADAKVRAPVKPKVRVPIKTPLPTRKPLGGSAAELVGFGAVAFLGVRRVRAGRHRPGAGT
jgi:putative pantetheine hydrolase